MTKKFERDIFGRFLSEQPKTERCIICGNKEVKVKNKCKKCYGLEYSRNRTKEQKERNKKYKKEYRNKHREDIHKKQNLFYQKNKEKLISYQKEYAEKNPEKLRERRKEYYNKNKIRFKEYHFMNRDRILQRKRDYHKNNREKDREYCKKNRKKIQKRDNLRRKKDKNFAIIGRLRHLVREAFRKFIREGKVAPSEKYGIDYPSIVKHLKPFPEDLSKYHIDHIKPLCSFEFVNPDGSTNLEEIKKAFSPNNHQWLLAEENLKKGGKLLIEQKNTDILCV